MPFGLNGRMSPPRKGRNDAMAPSAVRRCQSIAPLAALLAPATRGSHKYRIYPNAAEIIAGVAMLRLAEILPSACLVIIDALDV